MNYYLHLYFNTENTKCDKKELIGQFSSFGLEFQVYNEDIHFIKDNKINVPFGCSLSFIKNESWQEDGCYFEVMISDGLTTKAIDLILYSLINIGEKMGYRVLCNDVEIKQSNYEEFVFDIYATRFIKTIFKG